MNALKAQWVVRAGLIPGEEMPEYRHVWSYSSENYKGDGNMRSGTFFVADTAANDYATKLREGGLNWVTVEYLWM